MDEGSEPRWLSEQEQQAWVAFANVVMRLPNVLDSQLQRDSGLSHFEYVAMATLSTAPDRSLRMSVLASTIQASLSRLSQVVAKLERRGWVTRVADPRNRRYTLAALTDQGFVKVVEAAPGHVTVVRNSVFDVLDDAECRQLGAISRKILAALPPEATWPSRTQPPR